MQSGLKRRGFLLGILAAGVAPAIVRSPMKLWVQPTAQERLNALWHDIRLMEPPHVILDDSWRRTDIGLTALLAEAMRRHGPSIAANVERNNALLEALKRGGLGGGPGRPIL